MAQRARDTPDAEPVAPELLDLLVSIEAGQDHQLWLLANVVLSPPRATLGTINSNDWHVSDNTGVQIGSHNHQEVTCNPPVISGEAANT